MSNREFVCGCRLPASEVRLVVLTGGPGAGKTAVLETASRLFCEHVAVLPEAASLLFRGGFPRSATAPARASAQRAIFHVQRELELLATLEGRYAAVLCDRGTLDGLAYWPYVPEQYFAEVGSSYAAELARYCAVVHLCSPSGAQGYDHSNPVRIETAEEATRIDGRIAEVWAPHAKVHTVVSQSNFVHKLAAALQAIRLELPACCVPPLPP
jgi:predicted ATPase